MPRRWMSTRGNDKAQTSTFQIHRTVTHNCRDHSFHRGTFDGSDHINGCSVPSDISRLHFETNFVEHQESLTSTCGQVPLVPQANGLQRTFQMERELYPVSASGMGQHSPPKAGTQTSNSTHKRRWRKLSEVFRSGSESNKDVPQPQPLSLAIEEKKLGLPVTRNPWRNPASPLPPQDDYTLTSPEPQRNYSTAKDDQQSQLNDIPIIESSPPPSQHDDPSPQLHVDIPLTPLERFSVMFRDIHGGVHPGSLLGSKKDTTRETLIEVEGNKDSRLPVPPLRRRATSPTSSHFEKVMNDSIKQSYRSSRYSLFPTAPTHKSFPINNSPAQTRRRSITAPSGLQRQVNHRSTPDLTHTSSTAPSQTSSHSHKKSLSNSSGNEIFFDIKSFRGSSGLEGSQFEMTRPPSSVVQVERSKSNARRAARRKIVPQAAQNHDEDKKQQICGHPMDTCVQIDETIAIVESLTSPTSKLSNDDEPDSQFQDYQFQLENLPGYYGNDCSFVKSILDGPAREDTVVETSDHSAVPRNTQSPNPSNMGRRVSLTEDVVVVGTMIDPGSSTRLANAARDRHDALVKDAPLNFSTPSRTAMPPRANSNSTAHHLTTRTTAVPLSKYATNQGREDLVWQKFVRPVPFVRSGRSNTESNVNCNLARADLPRPQCSKRASSLPDAFVQVRYIGQEPTTAVATDSLALNGTNTAVTGTKSIAEVSVARKVSVVRRQNAKIVEPRTVIKLQPLTTSKDVERTISVQRSKEAEMKRRAEVDKKLPMVQEVHQKHKHGCSIDVVLDSARTGSSTSLLQEQLTDSAFASKLEKALPPIPV